MIGPYKEDAPLCSTLTVEQSAAAESCDCSDGWPSFDQQMNNNYSIDFMGAPNPYIALVPSLSTVSRGAGQYMTLQIYFFCKK